MDSPGLLEIGQAVWGALRSLRAVLGESPIGSWSNAPPARQQAVLSGVSFILTNPHVTPREFHERWLSRKRAGDWSYSSIDDFQAKTHPQLLEWEELSPSQQLRSRLFVAVVNALAPSSTMGNGVESP